LNRACRRGYKLADQVNRPGRAIPDEENSFPWINEMIDLKNERNFFQTRATEYQTGCAELGLMGQGGFDVACEFF
jgi:hypothetical protein